jgi:hypothetical protein
MSRPPQSRGSQTQADPRLVRCIRHNLSVSNPQTFIIKGKAPCGHPTPYYRLVLSQRFYISLRTFFIQLPHPEPVQPHRANSNETRNRDNKSVPISSDPMREEDYRSLGPITVSGISQRQVYVPGSLWALPSPTSLM